MVLNRRDVRPLHEQVVADLRRRIATGEFQAGDRLPSLKALRTEYDVAELTVHTAIRELQRQGVLVSSTGRGTFVTDEGAQLVERLLPQSGLDELRTEIAELRRRVEALEQGVRGLES